MAFATPAGDWRATIAWPLALAVAAIVGSLATACMMPFVAVAVLAALTMGRSQAMVTVLGCWAANQLIGFGLLGFPLNGEALAWGAALGATTLSIMFAARWIFAEAGTSPAVIALTSLAAFAGCEALLFAFALVAGGLDTFDPVIVVRLLANEAAWLLVLGSFRLALARISPRLFAGEPVRRMA